MEYQIISGDSHVDLTWLPADLFVSNAPSGWRDKVPRVVDTAKGKRWQAKDIDLGGVAAVGSGGRDLESLRGIDKQVDRMDSTGFYEDGAKGYYRPTTPDLRIKDQDMDGVQAEVLYGILGVAVKLGDPDLTTVCFRIYNDWVADFCNSNPDRLAALACVPTYEPQAAADELRRAAKLGLHGGEFPAATAGKPLYHPDWDVLWKASAECGMPISFHTTGAPVREPDPVDAEALNDQFRATRLTLFQIDGMEYLASLVFGGACDRFPDFKFVLGESGVSWIPYALERMDYEHHARFEHLGLSMSPSDFWRRQGYTTYQQEEIVAGFVSLAGEDNIIWGSDYPHPDGVWPYSRDIINRDLGSLEECTRLKIIRDNAATLYGFLN